MRVEKLSDIAAIALVVAALVPWGGDADGPAAPEIPAPSAEAKLAVMPITALLSGHGDQARELAAFYHCVAEVVRRDGAGANVLKKTSDLRVFGERAVTLRFQGVFQKVLGLSEAIHGPKGALAQLLKLDVVELDHASAADALDAVAWACQEAVP